MGEQPGEIHTRENPLHRIKLLNKCWNVIHVFIHSLEILLSFYYRDGKLPRQLLKVNFSGETDLKHLTYKSPRVTVIICAYGSVLLNL